MCHVVKSENAIKLQHIKGKNVSGRIDIKRKINRKILLFEGFGQLAQLDRALASGAKGRAFESRIAHFNNNKYLG